MSLLGVAVALLLLAGCTSGTDEAQTPTSPPAASVEPGPEPSQSPETTADPHPALADLVLSTAGLGPLTVGVSPTDNPGAAMIEFDAEFCTDGGPDPGRWVPAGYEDDLTYLGEPAAPFHVAATEAAVWRIDVMGVSPATAEGIGVGSTLTELQAAYPKLQGPFAGPLSRVWWVQDSAGSLVFETQGDAGGLRPAGTPEGVILIRVLAPGQDPAFATANSGDVADACG